MDKWMNIARDRDGENVGDGCHLNSLTADKHSLRHNLFIF